MKKKVFIAFIGGFFLITILSGCPPFEPLRTPSGKPEVTIPDVTKKEVIDALTELMIDKGYITRDITEDRAVYYKRTYSLYALPPVEQRPDFGPGPHSGLPYTQREPQPEAEVTYDITERDGGVNILATFHMKRFPETPFYEFTDISKGRDGHTIQRYLEELRKSMGK
jgi:hypothetical protein